MVLHILPADRLQDVLGRLTQLDLPNLWIPRANQFFHVESLPHLGSGKVDLRRLRQLATELSTAQQNQPVQNHAEQVPACHAKLTNE